MMALSVSCSKFHQWAGPRPSRQKAGQPRMVRMQAEGDYLYNVMLCRRLMGVLCFVGAQESCGGWGDMSSSLSLSIGLWRGLCWF